MYLHVCGCAISLGEGSSMVPTIIVGSFVSMMHGLRRTVIGQLTVEIFKPFFNARCGRKKRRERRLKNRRGRFPKALCYI